MSEYETRKWYDFDGTNMPLMAVVDIKIKGVLHSGVRVSQRHIWSRQPRKETGGIEIVEFMIVEPPLKHQEFTDEVTLGEYPNAFTVSITHTLNKGFLDEVYISHVVRW